MAVQHRSHAYLHGVVVNPAAGALDDTKVSLEVALTRVTVRLGVVGGAVEEDPSAGVVLHKVVVDHRTVGMAARRIKDSSVSSKVYLRCVERFRGGLGYYVSTCNNIPSLAPGLVE